jgi:hypothetical protein
MQEKCGSDDHPEVNYSQHAVADMLRQQPKFAEVALTCIRITIGKLLRVDVLHVLLDPRAVETLEFILDDPPRSAQATVKTTHTIVPPVQICHL